MHPKGFATRAIHAAQPPDSSSVPIYQMVSSAGMRYARNRNPTVAALEERVAALESGLGALATASGMNAISQSLLTLLSAGGRIVCHQAAYGLTRKLMNGTLARMGIRTTYVDMRDLDQVRRALHERAQVVYLEPISNPTLDVIDVQSVVEAAHEAGALVLVDNTFLSPYLLRPLELGADVVIHSATKYLCGHGDALGGLIVTREKALLRRFYEERSTQGGILSPLNAFLILRGLQTLPLRMERHCQNAQAVAEFLLAHERVAGVRYPGLPSHPGHAVAARQFRAFGGMLGFQVVGGISAAEKLCKGVKLCHHAYSFGEAASLVLPEADPIYVEGVNLIPDGYVRMSVGLEDVADITTDLDQALRQQ